MKEKFGLELKAPPPLATNSQQPATSNQQTTYTLVQDAGSLATWIAEATAGGDRGGGYRGTTSLDAMRAELVGVSLATAPGKSLLYSLSHVTGGGRIVRVSRARTRFRAISAGHAPSAACRSEAVLKIGQNIKYDMLVLARAGLSLTPVEDTMLLSYVLEAGKGGHGMDELAQRHLGIKTITYDEVTGTGKGRIPFAQVPLERARDYAAEDADVTLRLYHHLLAQVFSEHKLTVYETLERPLIPVLVAMERRGIAVDAGALDRLSQDFAVRMAALEGEIQTLAGGPFNVGSPKRAGRSAALSGCRCPAARNPARRGRMGRTVRCWRSWRRRGISCRRKCWPGGSWPSCAARIPKR